jgi:hypothetical protein
MVKHRIAGLALIAMLLVFAAHPVFSEPAESGQLIGKKICREAPGPDDTISFTIVLSENGTVQGEGSFSGATANFALSSGSWKETDDAVQITLIFSGKSYGPSGIGEGSKTIRISIQKSDLSNDREECYAFEGRL